MRACVKCLQVMLCGAIISASSLSCDCCLYLCVPWQENDLKGLIACCKRLGDPLRGGDPSLWADVLVFLGAHEGACEEEVREVLGVVEREALLPPLIVLQALSQNKGITVGVVKDYVARQLAKDTAAIEEDRKAVQRYQVRHWAVQYCRFTALVSCLFAMLRPCSTWHGERALSLNRPDAVSQFHTVRKS